MGGKGYHTDLWSQAPICRLGVFVQALGEHLRIGAISDVLYSAR